MHLNHILNIRKSVLRCNANHFCYLINRAVQPFVIVAWRMFHLLFVTRFGLVLSSSIPLRQNQEVALLLLKSFFTINVCFQLTIHIIVSFDFHLKKWIGVKNCFHELQIKFMLQPINWKKWIKNRILRN